MTEAERAFYEWFHTTKLPGAMLRQYREVFLAGWAAATVPQEPRGEADDG